MASRNEHRNILDLATGHCLEHVVSHDQHAGEEQNATQPTDCPERIGTLDLQGDSLVFLSEVKLSLDAANLAGGFTPGGGLQVLVWARRYQGWVPVFSMVSTPLSTRV